MKPLFLDEDGAWYLGTELTDMQMAAGKLHTQQIGSLVS